MKQIYLIFGLLFTSLQIQAQNNYADLAVQASFANQNANGQNTYQILVRNTGTAAFQSASIRVLGTTAATGGTGVPNLGTFTNGVWQLSGLAVGQSATLNLSGTTSASVCAQLLQSTPRDLNARNNASCASAQVALRRADLAVSININNTAPCLPGTACPTSYTVTLSNVGTVAVAQALVQLTGANGVSATTSLGTFANNVWRINSNFAPNQSATLIFSYTPPVNIAAPAPICATMVFSSPTDSAPANNRACRTVNPVTPQSADLALSLSTVLRPRNPLIADEPTCYDHTFTLRNNGMGTAASATINLTPTNNFGQSYQSGTASAGSFANGIWQINTPLSLGQVATLQVAQCYGGYFLCEPAPGCYELYTPVRLCGNITQAGTLDPNAANNQICDSIVPIQPPSPPSERYWQSGNTLISSPNGGTSLGITDGCNHATLQGNVPYYGSVNLSGAYQINPSFQNLPVQTVAATFVGSIQNGNLVGTFTAQSNPVRVIQINGTPSSPQLLGCAVRQGVFGNPNHQVPATSAGGCFGHGVVLRLTQSGGTFQAAINQGSFSQPFPVSSGAFSFAGMYQGASTIYSGTLNGDTMILTSPIQVTLEGGVDVEPVIACP